MNNVSNTKTHYQSENIIKLRALVNKMETDSSAEIKESSQEALLDLRRLMMKERQKISKATDLQDKVNLYEGLCTQITVLLNEIKIN